MRSDYHPRDVPKISSTQLADTEIVPTLDTPLAASGNAVWCATFQIAWNRARDDVIGGPLQIANAQLTADRLNGSPVTDAALPADSYYAAAGRLKDGIVETITREMARKFPNAEPPVFSPMAGFVAYGYLNTKATFTTPFDDTKRPVQFRDAAGGSHAVRGFGLHEGSDYELLVEQAAQVSVLFSQADDESDEFSPRLFALDLTARHADQQVIVAVLPRASDLRDAWTDLADRIETSAPDEQMANLHASDSIAIPNVAFYVQHEFVELQGEDKTIKNPGESRGAPMMTAAQSIEFRLDKSGATVFSEAEILDAAAMGRRFVVDQPFLVVMKRRSSDQPYFVAWIDNAEFLEAVD
ncbi:MAG: hypothetical protein KDA44_07790 [Planctomycetales bacterium]|nr:hypothetical protein [Planctomycetales bacterium]